MIKTKKRDLKFYTAYLWIRNLQQNNSPIDNLKKKGINSIIVYGMAELGELLTYEALLNKINIVAITDQKVVQRNNYFYGIPIIPVEDLLLKEFRNICVVITSMNFNEEIENKLETIGVDKVITLMDLL